MKYLMIENPGVAPIEAFSVFGASNKKELNIPGLIGTFGSGANMGTITLLRQGIPPTVFCGKTRMDFYTQPLTVTDVSGASAGYKQVCIQYGGTSSRKQELSWTTQYGHHNWQYIPLSLREYVSNAIDALLMLGKPLKKVWDYLNIEITDSVRAKDGYTRVYVPIVENDWRGNVVQAFYDNLNAWFLHAEEPESLGVQVLEKNARSVSMDGSETETGLLNNAVFYRRGVFVRQFEREAIPSLFDYNIDELPINESRTVDDWNILQAAGRAIKNAQPHVIAQVLRAIVNGDKVWETRLSGFSLTPDEGEDFAQINENWQKAIEMVGGPDAVVVSNPLTAAMVTAKGFNPILLPNEFFQAIRGSYKVRNEDEILTEDDKAGRTFEEATPPVLNTLNRIWKVIEEYKMTNGKAKPPVRIFHEQMKAECEKFGYYAQGTVYVHRDYTTNENDALDLTILEELAHHSTGAGDNSRDLQQWLFRFIHMGLLKKGKK